MIFFLNEKCIINIFNLRTSALKMSFVKQPVEFYFAIVATVFSDKEKIVGVNEMEI